MRLQLTGALTALTVGVTGCVTMPPETRIGPDARVTDLPVVAVMPLQHPSLAFLQSRSLTEALASALAARNPDAQVVTADEVADRLRMHRLLPGWADFLAAYRDSNVVNGGTVIDVGQLLEVSGIVLLSLFPGDDATPAELELSVFECAGGTLEWAGSSLLHPLGILASKDRVSQIHERLAELLDLLPALRQP